MTDNNENNNLDKENGAGSAQDNPGVGETNPAKGPSEIPTNSTVSDSSSRKQNEKVAGGTNKTRNVFDGLPTAAKAPGMVECIKSSPLTGGFEWLPNTAVVDPTDSDTFFHKLARIILKDSANIEIASFDENNFQDYETENEDLITLEPSLIKREMYNIALKVKMNPDYVFDNSGTDLHSLAENKLKKKFASKVYRLIIANEDEGNSVSSIGNLDARRFKVRNIRESDADANRVPGFAKIHDMLRTMEGLLDTEYLKNAVWLTSSALYTKIITMKDGNQNYIEAAQTDSHGERTLRNRPVYCHDAFNDVGNQLILVDLKRGMTIAESPELRRTEDRNSAYPNVINRISKRFAVALHPEAWVALRINDDVAVDVAPEAVQG